ncbi:MAG: SoxR reducing system RseC family protein [Oscillospiraceae bacterium]|nr:SoxR reducing system RseC family protein [Oscillospiraceae bacterium]
MKQIATVDKILANGRAEIVVARLSACAHDCHDCAGCGGTPTPIHAVVDNPIGAQEGQKVVVESSTRQMFGVLALVYMVPVALFFIAYFATASFGNDALSAGVSILAFFLGVVPAIRYDRRIKRSGGMTFTIVRAF